MKTYRVSLWLHGICAIRSQPIFAEDAEYRIENWHRVFGDKADIRLEAV